MTPRRLIIDCDPGHDDFAAIAMAAMDPDTRIEAIIASTGNAPVDKTAANALAIAAALDIDAPVFRGARAPLLNRYDFPTEFHGVTGMDSTGATLPAHDRTTEEESAALALIRMVHENPGALTIVVLGPMTNLALALALDPSITEEIRDVVFMGGGLSTGNVTARAEFNIWADPEAAAMVLAAPLTITMFGLDATNRAVLTAGDLERLHAAVPAPNPVADILQFYADRGGEPTEGALPGSSVHDPCTIAWLLDPSLFRIDQLPVRVNTAPGADYGATTADLRPWSDPAQHRIGVARDIDQPRFADRLTDALIAAARYLKSKETTASLT